MHKKNSLRKEFSILLFFVVIGGIIQSTISSIAEPANIIENKIIHNHSLINTQSYNTNELDFQYFRYSDNRIITKERKCQYTNTPDDHKQITSFDVSSVSTKPLNKGVYPPHAPIEIRGNDEFTPENGVTSGNGTINDPYIIEGWEIITSTNHAIVVVHTSAYFIIRNCYLQTAEAPYQGLLLYELQNGMVDNVTISSGYEGIEIWDSSEIVLSNLTISDAYTCIDIQYGSHQVSIRDSTLTDSETGIRPFNANYIEISNVTTLGVSVGIHQVSCHYLTITDCTLYGNNHGIDIISSGYTTMRNNTMQDNKQGLIIDGLIGYKDYVHDIDTSNIINGNPIYYYKNQSNLVIDGNEGIGFLGFLECNNITVKNFHKNNTGNSIIMAGSRDSQILQSTFTSNTYGITIAYCEHIFIADCITDTIIAPGIMLINSQHCTLQNNSIINSPQFPFEVYGNRHLLDDFVHDIDTSNTINGKPIWYLVGEKNIRITKNMDFAYLALVNCQKIQVININFDDFTSQGILLANTTGIIRGCTVNFNVYGFEIIHCTDLWILNCVARGCFHGFEIWDSMGVKILGCRATAGDDGFYIDTCSEILIMGCNTFNNGYQGINLYDSWNNTIFNNHFTSVNYGGIVFRTGCHENEVCFNTIVICHLGISISSYDWGQYIHHNTIKQNDFDGVDLYESVNNTIVYNVLENNYAGIEVIFDAGSQIHHNNIAGNDEGMVVAHCTANVSNNWWGSADGPSGIGPGSGDILRLTNATAYYEPWLDKEVRVKLHGLFYIITDIFF